MKNNNNKNKKRGQRQNGKQKAMQKYSPLSTLRTVFGQPASKLISWTDVISTVNANAYPIFSSTAGMYFHVHTAIAGTTDFGQMNDCYQQCKVKSFYFEVSRLFTETSSTTIIAAGIPQLRMTFFPSLTAGLVSNNLVLDSECSYTIDPHCTSPSKGGYLIPKVSAMDSTNATFVTIGDWIDANSFTTKTLPGTIAIGWYSNGNALSSTAIFQVRLFAECIFACPY